MEQMTKSEALKAGYTMYGVDGQEFQHMNNIADMTDEDFNDPRGNLLVCDNEAHYASIDGDTIYDMVQDSIMGNSEFHDDTDEIPDMLKAEINWDEIAEKVNAVCKKRPYYFLTKIQLVNDTQAGWV